MAPKVKARSIRRKKRKFTGNRYTRTTKSPESDLSATEKTAENREDSISEESSGEDDFREDCKQTPSSAKHPSASAKKLGEQSDFSDSSTDDVPESIKGFRFVDLSILASVFQLFWCPVCKYGHVVLEEDKESKEGVCFSSCCEVYITQVFLFKAVLYFFKN